MIGLRFGAMNCWIKLKDINEKPSVYSDGGVHIARRPCPDWGHVRVFVSKAGSIMH